MKARKSKKQARLEMIEQLVMYLFILGMGVSIIYNLINN